MAKKPRALWEWKIVRRASWDAILKLNPRKMMGNPVMFVEEIARRGGTPLVVAEKTRGALGVIELKDVVKGGMRDRFNQRELVFPRLPRTYLRRLHELPVQTHP